MAELLVYARDNSAESADPAVWQRGEVVAVMPDGHQWGSGEDPVNFHPGFRPFVIVRVPGVSVEACQQYLAEHVTYDPFTGAVTERHGRRRWQFQFDEVMAQRPDVRDVLLTHGKARVRPKDAPDDGMFTLPWFEARTFLRDKKLNLRETRDL